MMKSMIIRLARKIPLFVKVFDRTTRLKRVFPRVVNIELTSVCNSHCLYCGRDKLMKEGIRSAKNMNIELLEKIIEDIKELEEEPEKVVPVGLGEPMLYGDLPIALKLLKMHIPQITFQLTTNGIYFPRKCQDFIIEYEIDKLIVSVNFHSRDLYKKYCGVDKLNSVISNTAEFLKRKGNRKPSVIVQLLNINENKKDIKHFKEFWKGVVSPIDNIFIRPFNDFGGTVDVKEFINAAQQTPRYPCPQIFDHLMINVDGYCFPCCMGITASNDDSLCIGNIKNQSIREIYSPDTRTHEVREIHKANEYVLLPKCKNCDTWSYGTNMFFNKKGRWV